MTSNKLTHIDDQGNAHMVDVSDKAVTDRTAIATGRVLMKPETLALILEGRAKKGDVLGVARIAGIMAAKRTSDLVPLCHPLAITKVTVELEPNVVENAIDVRALVKVTGQTGVEMEALTAASIACLTIYDMVKAVDRGIVITDLKLIEKSGGKSGTFRVDTSSNPKASKWSFKDILNEPENSKQQSFKMTKAILNLAEKNQKIDPHRIWDGTKAVEELNNRVLAASGMGGIVVSENGAVDFDWTDNAFEEEYAYSSVHKDKYPEEYKRRVDNRKRLNILLSDSYKAAIALQDGGAKSDDLDFEKIENIISPVIYNAPIEIAGENADGKVMFGARTLVKGASLSATMTSLVKLATDRYKKSSNGTDEN